MIGLRVWQQSHGIMYVRAAVAYGCEPLPPFHRERRRKIEKRAWKRAMYLRDTAEIYRLLGP